MTWKPFSEAEKAEIWDAVERCAGPLSSRSRRDQSARCSERALRRARQCSGARSRSRIAGWHL